MHNAKSSQGAFAARVVFWYCGRVLYIYRCNDFGLECSFSNASMLSLLHWLISVVRISGALYYGTSHNHVRILGCKTLEINELTG